MPLEQRIAEAIQLTVATQATVERRLIECRASRRMPRAVFAGILGSILHRERQRILDKATCLHQECVAAHREGPEHSAMLVSLRRCCREIDAALDELQEYGYRRPQRAEEMTSHADYHLQLLLAHAWPAVAGADIGAVTLVSSVAEGVVTVLTPSAAWVEALAPRTTEFVERLNHAFLAPLVKGIVWAEGVPATKGVPDGR